MSITKKDIKDFWKRIDNLMHEYEPCWSTMEDLKLYDLAYDLPDLVARYCKEYKLPVPDDSTMNMLFDLFCEDTYIEFEYWIDEHFGGKPDDYLEYIGRTSRFYIGGLGNVNDIWSWSIEELEDKIGFNLSYWYEEEAMEILDIADLEDAFQEAQIYLERCGEIYDYIECVKAHQVDYFIEWLENSYILENIA